MEMPNNGVRPSAKSLEIGNKLLAEMEKFATSPGCRRRSLLKYFGEDMGERRFIRRMIGIRPIRSTVQA